MLESIPRIRFGDPFWLGLLLAIPVMMWMARRSIAGLGRFRAGAALATRAAVTALIVAALAHAQLVRIRGDMAVAYVVDRSLSVPAEAQQQALDFVTATHATEGHMRPSGDQVGLVTFGTNAAIDTAFAERSIDVTTLHAMVNTDHTNIAAGIRAATAAMPPAGRKRIVLVTDGNENDGAALSEAAAARAAGIHIDCVPVRYGYTREVMIDKVVAPSEVTAGKTVSIRVIARAFEESEGKLRLYANDRQIAEQDVALKAGANVYVLERVLDEPGVYSFKATIESQADNLYQNNQATAFSIVRGEKKVLIVEGREGDATTLAQALVDDKIAVEVVPPSGIPPAIGLLTGYDTVILVNVPAFDLAAETINLLAGAVREYGVGLVMVGGEDSFGAGGWRGTEVEKALPVDMDIKDREIIPTGALVIVMHTCEFPDGNSWGIKIAKAAVDTLGTYDEFGLCYYSYQGAEQWLVPLRPVTNRQAIKNLINTMQAGDMPSFDTTLKMADAALTKSRASVKHIVIISDGDPQAPSTAFLQAIAAKGITISTVAVFPHDGFSSGTLESIAKVGRGKYYYPASASELPQIFIKEAQRVRRGLIQESPFRPSMVLDTTPVTGFRNGDFPTLRGYVLTQPKPLAETPLVTAAKDPLLAHWQYGLGRAVAFTSDARPKWAADWVTWNQYRRFWGQVVEWVERKVENSDFSTSCTVRADEATIAVDAIGENGDFINFLQFGGTVLGPDGSSQPVSLAQTAPGHYEGTFRAGQVGTYLPIVNYKDPQGTLKTYTSAVTVPFSPEYRALSSNDLLLKEIADITGGRVIGVQDDVFRRDFPPEASYTDIWQWMVAAAAVLFLADVFLRRVIVDYAAVAARVREAFWWAPWVSGRAPVAQRVAYTSALLAAKKSVGKEEKAAAAKKFAPDAHAPAASLEELSRDQAVMRAQAAADKRAPAPPREIRKPAGDGYTSRLLDAKRRARGEKTDKD